MPALEYMPTRLALHPLWPDCSDILALLAGVPPASADKTLHEKQYKVLEHQLQAGKMEGKSLVFINRASGLCIRIGTLELSVLCQWFQTSSLVSQHLLIPRTAS
jgi:hypothetical protein